MVTKGIVYQIFAIFQSILPHNLNVNVRDISSLLSFFGMVSPKTWRMAFNFDTQGAFYCTSSLKKQVLITDGPIAAAIAPIVFKASLRFMPPALDIVGFFSTPLHATSHHKTEQLVWVILAKLTIANLARPENAKRRVLSSIFYRLQVPDTHVTQPLFRSLF